MHRSVAAYGGWLRSAILSFKYHDERARAPHLGGQLAGIVPSFGPIEGLVPVPLHPTRLRARGYNQAELLAREASKWTGVPLVLALRRTRATPQQVGLGAEERAANVGDAFAIAPDCGIAGKRLALVDDVTTTGATLGACAEVLIQNGALDVVSLTLAREI